MSKKIRMIAALIIPIVFALSFWCIILPSLPERSQIYDKEVTPIVLSLWHVETFEGGVGSRVQWLSRFAKNFENKNEGVYISIQKLSFEQLCNRLKSGQTFDMVSFGCGVGEKVLSFLQPYDGATKGFKSLLSGGMLDGRQYAVPIMTGGYLLAAMQSNIGKIDNFVGLKQDVFRCEYSKKIGKTTRQMASVACGFALFNSPLSAIALCTQETASQNSFVADTQTTQYVAYENFLNNKTATILLGTQRDFCRLDARQQSGNIGAVIYEPLENFSDLVQYIAIGKTDNKQSADICQKFIEYITSTAVQSNLSQIGMLPVVENCDAYSEGILKEMSDMVCNYKTVNVFSFFATINDLREGSKQCLLEGKRNIIEKYICTS